MRLLNSTKVKILKEAKKRLSKSIKGYSIWEYDKHDGICVFIERALYAYNQKATTYDEIQKIFHMYLIKPREPWREDTYWWDWDKKSYLIRHKAINTLIKHFS